jgi:glycine/D-amino acid oxidase-like deaminating enzyme/nitrite reductase/ring-hydroxylating ferredoxin subunit
MTAFTAGETRSIWTEEQRVGFPSLPGDREVDVAIIGAGIAGATTAALLKRAGLRVAVIDAARIGVGESGRTTAHLTEALDVRYHDLVGRFGLAAAREVAAAQRASIDLLERLCEEVDARPPERFTTKVGCGFTRVPGYLFAEDAAGEDDVRAEADAAAHVGCDVRLVDELPLAFPIRRALRFERQAELRPVVLVNGLLASIPGDGSGVFEQTRALAVHDGEPCRVDTDRGTIVARSVVIAAHVPVTNRFFLHTKIAPYRTYVVAGRTSLPADVGLFWDTADPYHYVRASRFGDDVYLIVGGEDHKVGHHGGGASAFERLADWMRPRFGEHPIAYRWSGQIIEPADGLPYIGRNALSSRVFVATGFAGNGMTGGALAALILSDEVQGRPNRWAELFAATRLRPMASARAFVRENADVARHLVGDRLRRSQVPNVAEIRRGEGRIVIARGERLAVYRDDAGELSACSATCTHLGCVVTWNDVENTWDCPCHGSRYDPYGEVINGPATAPLARREIPSEEERERGWFGLQQDPA